MSITDEIVLLDRGFCQQKDSPQELYRNPVNKFVAAFLGNPPISILPGRVESGRVMLNGFAVREAPGLPDRTVDVGIRPEGWYFAAGGIPVRASSTEIVGKDMIVNFELSGLPVRAITDIDHPYAAGDPLSLKVKPAAVFLFDPESGNRVRLPE